MIQGKLTPLDYDVEIPRLVPLIIIKDEHNHWSPRYLGRFDHVPLFGEYAPMRDEDGEGSYQADYDDFIKDSYTLRELVSYFEKFVALVAKVTNSLREPDLQDWERQELLDMFYGDEWADWGNYLSPRDNYYYAQSVPELRAVEVALFFLSSPDYPWKMDIGEVRRHVDELKLELWQCLPDFYAAHDHPMPRPFSYQPSKPYPLFHVADDFISGLRPAIPLWVDWSEDDEEYLPQESDTSQINKLSFELEKSKLSTDVLIKDKTGKVFWIDNQTYMADYTGLIEFVEDVLMCKDPANYGYDSEGPISEFVTGDASRPDLVRFVLYLRWNEHKNYINGFFDRRQLIADLIVLCNLIIEHSYELRYEPHLREPLVRRLERLRSIM